MPAAFQWMIRIGSCIRQMTTMAPSAGFTRTGLVIRASRLMNIASWHGCSDSIMAFIRVSTKEGIVICGQTLGPLRGINTAILLYWDDGDGAHHATIVTKVENGHIYYSGNTDEKIDFDLETAMGNNGESVHIVKLKDECFD